MRFFSAILAALVLEFLPALCPAQDGDPTKKEVASVKLSDVDMEGIDLGVLADYFELENAKMRVAKDRDEVGGYSGGPVYLVLRAKRPTLGADWSKLRAGFFDGDRMYLDSCEVKLPEFPLNERERIKVELLVPGDFIWQSVTIRRTEVKPLNQVYPQGRFR
jgi:hypothetical protein